MRFSRSSRGAEARAWVRGLRSQRQAVTTSSTSSSSPLMTAVIASGTRQAAANASREPTDMVVAPESE